MTVTLPLLFPDEELPDLEEPEVVPDLDPEADGAGVGTREIVVEVEACFETALPVPNPTIMI